MKLCNFYFDKSNLIIDLQYLRSECLNLKFVVTDLEMDCPYYSWEQLMCPGASIWMAPLNPYLQNIAVSSKTFSGFRCKVYNNQRLLQVEEFPYNKVTSSNSLFVTNEFDIIGSSYLDFFHSDLCENIDTTGIIIDAGANAGFFTLYALANGAERIYSIEPDQSPFYYLNKNFQDNPKVITINKALSSTCENIEFFHVIETSVASSKTKVNDASIVGNVESISLQNILSIDNKINLVKLDIEGSEFEVLESLTDKDFKKINQFFIEFHAVPTRIVEILNKNGFRVEFRRSSINDSIGFIYGERNE